MTIEKREIKETEVNKADEIDLLEVLHKIWDNRKIIYRSTAIFFILGLIIVFASPREYKTEVKLLVETSSSSSGMSGLLQQFGGLASLGNLGSTMNEDALTPELYPDILKSTPFLLGILDVELTDSKHDSTLIVSDFLDRHTRQSLGQLILSNTIGLPGKLLGLLSHKSGPKDLPTTNIRKGPLKLTPEQSGLTRELSKRITAKEGELPNTLVISIEMQDPQLVAQLADSIVKSLTAYIIDYRTQKAKADLQFVKQSHFEAEKKYISAQRAFAAFKDRNMNIVTASAQISEQNLQAEYTLAFNLFSTLSQQLEQAKLKVQEKTPVFKVMEPAKVPLNKSKPRTILVLIAMVFLGGILAIGIMVAKMIL